VHKQRIKDRIKSHFVAKRWLEAVEGRDFDRAIGIMCSTHMVACSCWMCGHQRKHFGVTFQEKKANESMEDQIDWTLPVKYASDCEMCEGCGEPWCVDCQLHYADCPCPGPHSEPDDE